METKKIKDYIQPAGKLAGVLGTVGGFIGDVLSPLGPILTYLIYLSIVILTISIVLLVLLPTEKREMFKKTSLTSLFFVIIFSVFGQFNKNTDNGFMGDNLEFVSNLQNSLNIIDEKLDNISYQIDEVDEKITKIDEKLNVEFDNLSELIKTSNPIKNPKTPKDFLVNAYLFRNGGDLNKSEESFNRFFEISGNYKIDVFADFIEVLRNNKGKNFVQTYYESRQDINDDVFVLFKTIFQSKKENIISNIKKLDININLIDFGILYVTNNGGFWNDLASYGAQENNINLYIKTAIELSENDVRFRSIGMDEINYLILNKENLNKLIYNQANPYERKTLIQFYFTTIQTTLSVLVKNDPRINSEKAAFLQQYTPSKNKVTYPEGLSIDEYETYYIEKFGEKFYFNQNIPAQNGEALWKTYIESRNFYNNL